MPIDWDQLFQQLVRNQQGYVSEMAQTPMSSEFGPTLDEMLRTGSPTSTRGTEAAAESEAMRMWERLSGGINERMTMQGKGGSSAQTGLLSRAGGDVSSRMGEILAKLRSASAESAQGRRMGAMGEALSESRLAMGGKEAQAGAGMNLLNLLKTLEPAGGAGGGRPELAGSQSSRQLGQGQNRPIGGGGISSKSRDVTPGANLLGGIGRGHKMARGQWARRLLSGGMGGNALREMSLYTDPTNIAMLNPSIAPTALEAGRIGTEGYKASQQGSSAATAANQPMLQENARQKFMRMMIEMYGSGFGG